MISKYQNEKYSDEYWMAMALSLARKAFDLKEVPVGCVIVANNKIISKASNLKEKLQTPLAHAEVLAIHKASKKGNLGDLRTAPFMSPWSLVPCVQELSYNLELKEWFLQARILKVAPSRVFINCCPIKD